MKQVVIYAVDPTAETSASFKLFANAEAAFVWNIDPGDVNVKDDRDEFELTMLSLANDTILYVEWVGCEYDYTVSPPTRFNRVRVIVNGGIIDRVVEGWTINDEIPFRTHKGDTFCVAEMSSDINFNNAFAYVPPVASARN